MTVKLPQWYNSPARPTRIPKRRPGGAKITVIVPTRNEVDNLLPVLVRARPHAQMPPAPGDLPSSVCYWASPP